MKKIVVVFIILFSVIFVRAQSDEPVNLYQDEGFVADTSNIKKYKNVFGINAYPALGIFGGSRAPNVKIFIQYKYLMKNINFKGSINYSDFFKNDYSYFMGILEEQHVTDSGTFMVDSALFRHHRNNSFAYDIRFGVEAKLDQRNVSVFAGADLVFGLHKTSETYQFSKKNFIENEPLPLSFYFNTEDREGFRNISYLKMGMDFTFGLDINLSDKILLTIQYSPELIYYYNIKEKKKDPNSIYPDKAGNSFQFVPYFVDVIFSVRF